MKFANEPSELRRRNYMTLTQVRALNERPILAAFQFGMLITQGADGVVRLYRAYSRGKGGRWRETLMTPELQAGVAAILRVQRPPR